MELNKIFEERFSVRSFKDIPVEDEKIQELLKAAQLAPTAHNNQPQRIFVLKSAEAIEKIRACTKCAFNAPVVLMICANTDEVWQNRFSGAVSSETDAAIVTTYMMLKAWDMGLGSCWVHYFDPVKIREAFDLPENLIPYNLLPLGYAADDAAPIPMHFENKAIEDFSEIL